jgi:hypothetical protein
MMPNGYPTERSFGLTMGSVSLALAGVAWWRGHPLIAMVLLSSGLGLMSFALNAPSMLAVPNRLWWRFAQTLGRLNARILLSVFFVGVLTPIGVAMRLFGRNVLTAHRPHTNWRPYPSRRSDSKHYEHLF